MEIFDLRTGLKALGQWIGVFRHRGGWLPSPGLDTAILVLGRTANSATTLMAVDSPPATSAGAGQCVYRRAQGI